MAFVNNEFPVFDGIAPSWADLQIKVKGKTTALLDMRDVKEIKTGGTVEVGEQGGVSGGRIIRTTTGKVKYEASWVLYHTAWPKLLRNIRDMMPRRGNQRIISLAHISIQYLWTPPIDTGDNLIYECRIKGCRIIGRNLAGAEGVEASTIEVPLHAKEIADVIDGEEYVLL
jgi:hypothetical protein